MNLATSCSCYPVCIWWCAAWAGSGAAGAAMLARRHRWSAVHGSGGRGDRVPAGGSCAVHQHRKGACEQGRPDSDQSDLPAEHAARDDDVDCRRQMLRHDGGPTAATRRDLHGECWCRGECHQGGGQPGQDASDTADVLDGVHDDLLRLWMSFQGDRTAAGLRRESGADTRVSRGVPYISAAPATPSRAACAAAASRVGVPSLASTAETWWSTVLGERNSLAAISALLCPALIRSSTSRSRRVSPSGSDRVAVRGPAGIDRTPSRRILCRVSWAAAGAPRPVKICSAWRSAASSLASCRASAAS